MTRSKAKYHKNVKCSVLKIFTLFAHFAPQSAQGKAIFNRLPF